MTLTLADWARLHDNDFVADTGFVVFVVGYEFFADRILLAVQRMGFALPYKNDNSLVGLVAGNDTRN